LKIYGGVKPKGLQKLLNKEADRQPYFVIFPQYIFKKKSQTSPKMLVPVMFACQSHFSLTV